MQEFVNPLLIIILLITFGAAMADQSTVKEGELRARESHEPQQKGPVGTGILGYSLFLRAVAAALHGPMRSPVFSPRRTQITGNRNKHRKSRLDPSKTPDNRDSHSLPNEK